MEIYERRLEKFKAVISKRQEDVAIVLENIHDPHNIGAILRSCDSVGVHHIYVITTDKNLQQKKTFEKLSSASGASKWLSLKMFTEIEPAVKDIKSKFKNLYATHLTAEAGSIYDLDFTEPCAIAFGNEHDGISEKLLELCDANVLIPQVGMVQSLNISVACAVSLFEIFRQKQHAGHYDQSFDESSAEHQALYERYQDIHKEKKLKKLKK